MVNRDGPRGHGGRRTISKAESPAGAGLGGSSALALAVAAALARARRLWANGEAEPDERTLIKTVRKLLPPRR